MSRLQQPTILEAAENAPDEHPRTWRPVDLTAVLSGQWRAAEPSIGSRSDGIGLFYPGKVHTLSSESEAGKSWFALAAVVHELGRCHTVAYLDFEDDEGGVVGRLLSLQVAKDVIRGGFRYVRPVDPLGAAINVDDLRAAIAGASLVVLDGVTEAMTLHGLDPLNNKDAATFGRILPRRIADTGAAVVCLDHVTKDREGRGRYALGAVHKLNALDGAAYLLDNRTSFGIGLTGRSTVKLAKDRPGQLRKHGLPSSGGLHWFADLVLTSHGGEDFAEVTIEPPIEHDDEWRPTVLMERIAQLLEERGPLSGQKIETAIKGKAATIRHARHLLELDGYVSEETPHRLLKPYRTEGD